LRAIEYRWKFCYKFNAFFRPCGKRTPMGDAQSFREETIVKSHILIIGSLATVIMACGTSAQTAPAKPDEVALPSGKIPGAPKIALVKVADGFLDPTNATNAGDGSGRIFVVERAGTVRIVGKDGKVLPKPFLDLTKINPLGTDVQTASWSKASIRSPSIRNLRKMAISLPIMPRSHSMATASSCAIRSIPQVRTSCPPSA
jgi:hypothetical protein